jgi:predicted nucleic acid-binding protein
MSGPLYLLDTNIVLAMVRGKALANRIDRTYGLRSARTRPLIARVTHGELWVLATRNGWGEAKRDALQNALDNLVTVDIHHPEVIDAYVAIDVFSQRHPQGARNMGKNDLWIAACAKAANATLLTTDKDFGHLAPEVVDVAYVDPASV